MPPSAVASFSERPAARKAGSPASSAGSEAAVTTATTAEGFGDGEHTVGKGGVVPGIYESKTPGPACQWTFKTIPNEIKGPGHLGDGKRDPSAAQDRWVLELSKDDHLTVTGCGQWTRYVPPAGEPPTSLQAGTYLVGPEAKAGSWEVSGTFVRVDVYGLEGASRGGSTNLRSRSSRQAECAPDPSIPACNGSTMGLGVSEGQFLRVRPAPGSKLVWYG